MTRYISVLAAWSLGGFGFVTDASAFTVTGYLEYPPGFTNYLDPATGFVPPGYDNETSPFITFPRTFGSFDGAKLVSASFAQSYTVTINDVTSSSSGPLFLDFYETSPQPKFNNFRLMEDTFPGLLYGELDGAFLINWPGTTVPGAFTAKFVFSAPESATWATLLLGFTGLAWTVRRRPSRIVIPRLVVGRSA
jgi:hypothetical protein